MDVFEPVRAAAGKLHADLAVGGVDPWQPLAFVEAAADGIGLEISWVPEGDPVLKGGRASYDEQSGLICCEGIGTEADRALLAAHEIGHARVHGVSCDCVREDVDASRSTEAAPVGLQRVEDYGARERRELQANVFAREFFLPRGWIKRLYLDEQLGANDIAQRTGLPKNLVRQQLLDALLLPESPLAGVQDLNTAPAVVPEFDRSQDTAAGHHGGPFQLQAGPGTGKTRTLVERVKRLLHNGIEPAEILVLTFSNRAAGELFERIARTEPEAVKAMWIGTFHAFGLDLVRRYYDRLDLPPAPALFDRSDAISVLEEILPTLPLVHYRNLWDPTLVLRDIVVAISRAKDELVDHLRYKALADDMLAQAGDDADAREAVEKCLEVAHVYALYEQALRERRAVDFGDLIMRPALLLEADAGLCQSLRQRHRHILVDEYQDVNRASARLLQSIAGPGENLWVVGDARQSIYRFRGASSLNMGKFVTDYPNAQRDRLLVNYRSSALIVESFVEFSEHMGASENALPLGLTAFADKEGSQSDVRVFDHPDDEVDGIAGGIRELEQAGIKLRDQAVLCRSNLRLNQIAAGLEARGIPVLHLGSLFEREEVRDLLALLSLATDPFGGGLTRVAALARYNIPLQDIYLLAGHLRHSEHPILTRLRSVAEIPGISTEAKSALQQLTVDLETLSERTNAWDFLTTYLLDRVHAFSELASSDHVPERMKGVALWQFLNFVREQPAVGHGVPIQRTLERVRQLVLLAEERELRQVPTAALDMDAVRLMTVHGSKGLEFEAVHLPGLTVTSFPASDRPHPCLPPRGMIDEPQELSPREAAKRVHQIEEECLFFVAISRARFQLRLYRTSKMLNGNKRSPSHFLGWLPARATREHSLPPRIALPPGSTDAHFVVIDWNNRQQFTDSRVMSYDGCPRRFFYTHVLRLGGGRRHTAFTRTHDCLYELIDWLYAARVAGDVSLAAAEAEFERIWQQRGPASHAFAADYRALASRLIGTLHRWGTKRKFRLKQSLPVSFQNGEIIVEPHEIVELDDATVVLRRVHTGRQRSNEYDRLEYALYLMAAERHYPEGSQVEALHLTDEATSPVEMTDRKMTNRRAQIEELLKGIAEGRFPMEVDPVRCPRCPHFFICPSTPVGSLKLV